MTVARRRIRGSLGYHAGAAAENCIARNYERRGFSVAQRRWRGQGGEIDLIAENGEGLVFIEVKKSRTFDTAVARLTQRQMARIQSAAEEYLGTQPKGALTDVRFDVALVDGQGDVRVIENAIGF